jgi:hypothetical protein
MKSSTHTLPAALVMCCVACAGVCSEPCQAEDQGAAAAFGWEAVWRPADFPWSALHATCGNGEDPQCLPEMMRRHGASAAALAVAERFQGQSFLLEFKDLGRVSLATLDSPFSANVNETYVLVNGVPDVVDVATEAEKVDSRHDDTFAAILKLFPQAFIDTTLPAFVGTQALRAHGQRFIFQGNISNECRACNSVGAARIALDFDSSGRYLGPALLQVYAAAGVKVESRETGGTSPAIPADRLITSSSAGRVQLGMRISAAIPLLAPFQVRQDTVADGALVYEAWLRGETVMRLIPTPSRTGGTRIDESCLIHSIEVLDPGYATAAGVHAGMPLAQVENIYGKLRGISMSEVEMQELATFPGLPDGISLRVWGRDKPAGVYAPGARETAEYDPTAIVAGIIVTERGARPSARHTDNEQPGRAGTGPRR